MVFVVCIGLLISKHMEERPLYNYNDTHVMVENIGEIDSAYVEHLLGYYDTVIVLERRISKVYIDDQTGQTAYETEEQIYFPYVDDGKGLSIAPRE